MGVVVGNPDESDSLDHEALAILEQNGFKSLTLPDISSAVITEFPFYTMLGVLFAVKYVYPRIMRFCEVHFYFLSVLLYI